MNIILLQIVVLLPLWSFAATHCVHPPDVRVKKTALYRKIFHQYYLGLWSHNIARGYRTNAHHIKEFEKDRNKGGHFRSSQLNKRQSKIYGESKCKRNMDVTLNSTDISKATCPWFVVLDVDLNREPQRLAKAKCSCKRCLTAAGDGGNRAGHCSTVNSYIPVLKWECPTDYSGSKKYYHYFIHLEKVPVGCTCNRATQV